MDDAQLEAFVQKLRGPLSAYFHAYEDGRDLGRGTAFPTSANVPGGLQDKDRFYRTDLNFACVYDSTGPRWLTQQEHSLEILPRTINFSSAQSALHPIRSDYATYITWYAVYARVATTNNGSNYWNLFCQSFNTAITTNDNPYVPNTSAIGLNTWTSISGVPTIPVPTNRTWYAIQAVPVGSPGLLDAGCTMYYRLIIP